ncbi:MAG TPA: DUF1501 domain-containing protein [Planctomycetota bacterium]|nr:DUF1501 domain-containing protein [Planctomycetota bacterium]
MNHHLNTFCGRTRREFLWEAGAGFTSIGLVDLLSRDGFFGPVDGHGSESPLAPKPPHFPARAKAVIFLFMYGGPSQVDTFDYKPKLYPLDGKTIDIDTRGRGGTKNKGRVVGPKWSFRQYGQCGKHVSDLFPHLARCVDDIAFVHSMYADSPLHGSAMLMMNSGRILSGAPCLGSWATYGLGTENQNLPGFVVMLDQTGGPISGAKNWNSGYMPAVYQGTVLRPQGEPILDLAVPSGMTLREQRRLLDALREQNEAHLHTRADDSNLAARIESYELAFRMQSHAPEAIDLASESEATRRSYGLDDARTEDFGRKCLLARRLVERGVRCVQVYSGGNHNDNNWDAHGDLVSNHTKHAGATDQPVAALLTDLKQRGLLESTLVVWGGEFGRQPTAEYAEGTGRDHDSAGFTMWLAGGGIPGGISVGATDELGYRAVEKPFHVKHLHATILWQLGLDPNRLAFFHAGLNQRLVGTEGAQPIRELIA